MGHLEAAEVAFVVAHEGAQQGLVHRIVPHHQDGAVLPPCLSGTQVAEDLLPNAPCPGPKLPDRVMSRHELELCRIITSPFFIMNWIASLYFVLQKPFPFIKIDFTKVLDNRRTRNNWKFLVIATSGDKR